jgi:hypothetical protein
VAFEISPSNAAPRSSSSKENILEAGFPTRTHKRQKKNHPILLTPHPLPKPLIEDNTVEIHDLRGGRYRRGDRHHHPHTPIHTPTKSTCNDLLEHVVSPYVSGHSVIWNWNILNHPNVAIAFQKAAPVWRIWSDLRTLVIDPPVLHINLILHRTHRSAKVFERWPRIHVHAADATRGITLFDMFMAIYVYFQQPCSKTEIDRLTGLDEEYRQRQLFLARYRLERTTQNLPHEIYLTEMSVGLRRKHFLYHGRTMFEKIEPVPGACPHTYYLYLSK